MTVDEILANGRYTDRRGRDWAVLGNAWVLLDPWRWANKPKRESMTVPEMRVLIERDMHRDECAGLAECEGHPAWRVVQGYNGDGAWTCWEVIEPGEAFGTSFELPHGHALRIAQGMAVPSE